MQNEEKLIYYINEFAFEWGRLWNTELTPEQKMERIKEILVTPDEFAKELYSKINDDCKRMAQENNLAWCDLSLYLDAEHDEGKTEFRLVVNADKSFYIHPLGKDGKTFDGKL